jgi:hypothetical protein
MATDAPEPAPPRSYEPAAVARVLVSTGDQLVTLLAAESELIRAVRIAEIVPLGAEKSRLSQIFAAGWRQFQGAPGALATLAPELVGQLRGTALRVDRMARDNEILLRSARRASELVLAAIARAVNQQRPKPTYTAGRIARTLPRDHAGLGFNRSA